MATTQELERQARRHEAAGRFDRAARCYRDAIEVQRERDDGGVAPSLYLRLADLHFRRDEEDEAVDCYDRAADRYVRLGQVQNAVSVQEMSARLFPERVDADAAATGLYLRAESREDARDRLRRYLDRAGDRDPGEIAEALRGVAGGLDARAADALAELLEDEGRPGAAAALRPEESGSGEAAEVGPEAEREPGDRADAEPTPEWVRDVADELEPGPGEGRFSVRLLERNGAAAPDELGERAELRRAIALVDDLLEASPSDLDLVRRRLDYARRLGDRREIERSVSELARGLVDDGRLEAARILYRRLLEGDLSPGPGESPPNPVRRSTRQRPLRPRPER